MVKRSSIVIKRGILGVGSGTGGNIVQSIKNVISISRSSNISNKSKV